MPILGHPLLCRGCFGSSKTLRMQQPSVPLLSQTWKPCRKSFTIMQMQRHGFMTTRAAARQAVRSQYFFVANDEEAFSVPAQKTRILVLIFLCASDMLRSGRCNHLITFNNNQSYFIYRHTNSYSSSSSSMGRQSPASLRQ